MRQSVAAMGAQFIFHRIAAVRSIIEHDEGFGLDQAVRVGAPDDGGLQHLAMFDEPGLDFKG